MLHWKQEGEYIRQGLSFYHPKDTHSAGVVLRIGNRIWRCRYSKYTKTWYTDYQKADPNVLKEWETKHGLKND